MELLDLAWAQVGRSRGKGLLELPLCGWVLKGSARGACTQEVWLQAWPCLNPQVP